METSRLWVALPSLAVSYLVGMIFPYACITKIMQADEDVGKIALPVSVLVSKALELFVRGLCDRTYEITLKRGAKTMNSLHFYSAAADDDQTIYGRRKAAGDEVNDSDEESKRSRMHDVGNAGTAGRGRGRGRGRGARNVGRDSHHEIEPKPCSTLQQSGKSHSAPGVVIDDGSELREPIKEKTIGEDANHVQNFDLNAEVDDNADTKAFAGEGTAASSTATAAVTATQPSSAELATDSKHEEFPGWSLSDMTKIAIDPLQIAQLGRRLDGDEEDYDEEG